MMRRNNVVIVPARCQQSGKMFGIRAEKRNDGWHLNWAFEISEKEAAHERFGEDTISGRIVFDLDYPGCPHCGGMSFVRCGACGHLSCWDGEDMTFVCHHCGYTGELNMGMSTDEFDNIKAGDY